jgi:transcriptional regulator with GAF, ATPase, and Fis domain
MQGEPWLHFWSNKDVYNKKSIVEALASTGLHFRALDSTTTSGPGLLCIANVDHELLEFLRDVTRNNDDRILAVHVSSPALTTSLTWSLAQAGAADLLEGASLRDLASQIKARFERWRAIDEILASPLVHEKLVGASVSWRSTLRQIIEVARFTDAFILVIGESGTGKELIARLIHELDPNAASRSLSVLDCTTVVPELSGSEFFGHERGAFTGAVATREGAFALADGGTLFLDEVGELPVSLQAQLLRVIQEGTYKRVGSNAWQRTRFRLVCATNRDLLQLIAHGEFRNDLYYRIAGWIFRIPPLRERKDDILPLARHFLGALRPDLEPPDFEPPVREFLLTRQYPGNVRDLRQLIARIVSRHVGAGPITIGDVPDDERPQGFTELGQWRNAEFDQCIHRALLSGAGLKEISQAATDTAVCIAVNEEHGNLQLAARRLGVTDRALQMRRAGQKPPNGGPRGPDSGR